MSMRIRGVSPDQAAPEIREKFEREIATFGAPLPTTSVQAHCPPIMDAAGIMSAAIAASGTIPARLRLLLYVRVAARVGCPF